MAKVASWMGAQSRYDGPSLDERKRRRQNGELCVYVRLSKLTSKVGLRRALDRVSGQRDGHASGLYWFTDLGRARRAARALDRPVLSLRMLGRLDEERSCANSRYFRLMLYANERVARLLASRFVLHWSSEREQVPQITVDLGDGRRIESTITGNSVHYVLDAEGRPLDVIPGMYTPEGFARALEEAHGLWRRCAGRGRACVAEAHREGLVELTRRWNRGRLPGAPPFAALAGYRPGPQGAGTGVGPGGPWPRVPARNALPVAITKSGIEMPLLGGLTGQTGAPPPWASWHARPAMVFDARSRGLLRLKSGQRDTRALEARLVALVQEDELQNEFMVRAEIRERLASDPPATLEALNAWVYAEVFLTPASDPWLGLRDETLFDGIER